MTRYDHLKDKAIEFRNNGLALTEICKRLCLSKSTVYYWIKGIPLKPKRKYSFCPAGQLAATAAMQKKYRVLRESAYAEGKKLSAELFKDEYFRDFIVVYLCEGYRKSKNAVSVSNSNPDIIKLSYYWIKKFSNRKIVFNIQYHVDQDIEDLKRFWSKILGISPENIGIQRKSNSGNMKNRNWRSEFGVMTVLSADTYLRAKIEAWMDYLKNSWRNGV